HTLVAWVEDDFEEYAKRIKDTKRELFPNGKPDPQAVSQGGTGDCTLMSTLAAIANVPADKKPLKLPDIYLEDNIRNQPFYVVKFPGITPVPIDPPTDAQIALYASAGKDGLWLSVAEKEYVTAKNLQAIWFFRRVDEYQSMKQGAPLHETMEAVTGNTTGTISRGGSSNTLNERDVAAALDKAFAKGAIVCAATAAGPFKPEDYATKLPTRHAYAILAWDKAKQEVTIENPWMKTDFHGKAVKYGAVFTMKLDRFCAEFAQLVSEIK